VAISWLLSVFVGTGVAISFLRTKNLNMLNFSFRTYHDYENIPNSTELVFLYKFSFTRLFSILCGGSWLPCVLVVTSEH
jgi:hypothetical protein